MKCVMHSSTTGMFAVMQNIGVPKLCPAGLNLWDYLLSTTCLKLSERRNEWTLDTDAAHKEVIVNRYSQEDTQSIPHSAIVATQAVEMNSNGGNL